MPIYIAFIIFKDIVSKEKFVVKGELTSKCLDEKRRRKEHIFFINELPLWLSSDLKKEKVKLISYYEKFIEKDNLTIYISMNSHKILGIEKN